MQYLTGVVDVTNGSATVIGTNTLWLNQVEAGNAFTVTGTGVFYDVASVQSDTELTLSTPYTGTTQTGVTYTIARDFTALNNIVEMKKGDIETAAIFTRAVRRIDQLLSLNQDAGALTSAGVYANTTDGLAGTTSGDYFFVPDGSEFVLYLNSSGSAVEQLRFASLATALQYASDAQQAASDAQTAQAAAETAESNAQTSETNAAASATAASNSESNALASENTASQQAGIATDAANDALSDADRAEAARDAAQLSAGVYDDTTDGLNNTADGEYFSTPSANTDVYLILYRNDSGVATQIAEYPSRVAIDGKLDAAANLSDLADTPTARTNLDVYSKSESVAASPVQSVDGKTGTVDLSADYEQKRQNNLSATTDPTVNDDSGAGYEPLSRWINTSTGEIWLCIDASVGAADWQQATLTIDELGALALANNASDVPYSNTTSGLAATEVQAALDEIDDDVNGIEADYYNTGNILGTVSQSGGVPTGAIIERGSNANGEYAKYAGGTMICTFNDLRQANPGSRSDGLVQLNTWTFPAAFTAPPSVGALPSKKIVTETGKFVKAVSGRQTGADPDGASISLWAYGTADAVTMEYSFSTTAIGRWY